MSEIKLVRPDILDCLANLSSDEGFTPPKVVNEMLDMLPQDLFESPKTRFLDPFTKSGVFLREIVKRLDKGLAQAIPDKEDRLNHIFQRQVFGIACTQLTALFSRRSLYCNKNVQDKRSTARGLFSTEAGNIGYHRCHHTWVNGSCKICGASKKALSESKDVENYAYPFLHDEVFMKQAQELGFDVIIGNPPYQINDGGNSASAKPLYHLFVNQAKRLNPKFLTMIIPARWYCGGKGLDEFREQMLNDDRIGVIVDYVNSKDCFDSLSVSGGICYFLWNRDYHGDCLFRSTKAGKICEAYRKLNEYSVFIRYNDALTVVHKVMAKGEDNLSTVITSRNPYGIPTSARGSENKSAGQYKLISSKGEGYIEPTEVISNGEVAKSYKVMITRIMAEHAGEPDKDGLFSVLATIRVLRPKEVCTDTYVTAGCFPTIDAAQNLAQYLKTKFVRFLILQAAASINLSRGTYKFVPLQDFSKPWTDAELYKKYKLTDREIEFIESMIRPME